MDNQSPLQAEILEGNSVVNQIPAEQLLHILEDPKSPLQQADRQLQSEEPRLNRNRSRWPFSLSAQFRKLNLPDNKTQYCKHPHGCIQSILLSSIKIALAGYVIKSGMSLVFGLRKIFTQPNKLVGILISRDSMNFGCFLGSFVGLFRGILCLLRRHVPAQKQKYIPLIAGLFAGCFSVLFLQKKSRQTYALFLLARAIDVTYNSLVKKGILPQFKYFYVVLYSLMMAITGYAFGSEPGCMSPEMNKFYLAFTNQTISDMQMRQIWIERKNNQLAQFGIPRQNPLDYMPKLKKFYSARK